MRSVFYMKSVWAVLATVLCAASQGQAQCTEGCNAIHTWTGEAPGDQFGWVSNNVGDLDLDGINDVVLTAPTKDVNGIDSGRIYVYSGGSSAELFRVTGGGSNWKLGHDAAVAGDLNDDDRPEVIAGAPGSGAGRAIVYTYDGTTGGVMQTLFGELAGDQFGYRVWGGMDVDGDHISDIVVGAITNDGAASNAGRAYVYSGADFSEICTMDGETSNDQFGSGVALIGDVNGDDASEILVGARGGGTGTGRAYVYTYDGQDCTLMYAVNPPPGPATDFGLWFMNGGHDVNNDGTPDFYVNDYSINRAHIFSGVDGELIWTLTGDGNGQFGIGRIVEDLNGDCHADMLLAAWISSAGATNAGKAFVYSGADASVLETFTHNVAGAGFGFDANGMGDVDGDLQFDHLITAASDLNDRGRVYLISGNIADPPCDVGVPTASAWGLALLAMMLVFGGAVVLRERAVVR